MVLAFYISVTEAVLRAPDPEVPEEGGGLAPNPAPAAPPGLGEKMDLLISWGKWGVYAAGVIGLLTCSAMMMVGRKNRSSLAADGATGVPWTLGGLSLASVTAAIVDAFGS
ncbi:hypothetical protein EDD29_5772 [Actinocorallia herbida]|uniref:Uncharacterized protein n=1 Tax=Actinocorallia herbida TaxID=58109 RepID=A0A3N1D3J9_9ACTN|nr:hypothetical protein [Actinocorallia herbida]ROO88114.1 hypothetical protein EDD29_5772 [Actinocorallia herbida]